MQKPPSIHDLRRQAPAHYWAKADNARFVAYLLSQGITGAAMRAAADGAAYHGGPDIATHEAYIREAALALELIVKAVIAQKIQNGVARKDVVRVRAVHDIPKLWAEAELPKLANEDQRRLLLVKQILTWAGRYAAPKYDEQFERWRAEDEALKPPPANPRMCVERPLSLDWENFDRLYQIALQALATLLDR